MPKITPEWERTFKEKWNKRFGDALLSWRDEMMNDIRQILSQSQEEARKEGDGVEMIEVFVPTETGGEAINPDGQHLARIATFVNGRPIKLNAGVYVEKSWLTKEEANALSTSEEVKEKTYVFTREVKTWGVEAGDYYNPQVHMIQGGKDKLLAEGVIEEEVLE